MAAGKRGRFFLENIFLVPGKIFFTLRIASNQRQLKSKQHDLFDFLKTSVSNWMWLFKSSFCETRVCQ